MIQNLLLIQDLLLITDILGNDPKTEKVLVEVTIDGKKQLKRFSSKIIKMDENKQYGQAMTKPLPYDCIKKQKEIPTLTQFNKTLNSILHEDNIDHIFTVDPSYYLMRCIRLYLKKIKKNDPFERSTLQLMSVVVRDEEKEKINTFPYHSKTHSTLKEKKFVTLYDKDLQFLISKAE